MPEVTFRPINQCTLDDPTDGSEPPHGAVATPSGAAATPNGVAETPRGPAVSPPCQATVSGAGGRGGDECTDALVRRFSGEGGSPVIAEPKPSGSAFCFHETINALAACTPLLLARTLPGAYVASQAVQCAAPAAALVECLIK